MESLSSYMWIIITYHRSFTVSHIWGIIDPIFAVDRGVPLFNALVRGESLNWALWNLASRNSKHPYIVWLKSISIYWNVETWLTSVTGRTLRYQVPRFTTVRYASKNLITLRKLFTDLSCNAMNDSSPILCLVR